jgi:subtilisin-like proprotein convertase family protein
MPRLVGWISNLCVAFSVLCLYAAPARADTNPTPIAVPLLHAGDPSGPQPGAPYPSTINLVSRQGPAFAGPPQIRLHAVTHPCPEDLAVLLVKGSHGYLLMANAGSCRPLQGTDIVFDPFTAPLPDSDPLTTPWGSTLQIGASVYGATPVFPAPAPPGPYTIGVPTTEILDGTWSLFVMDTRPFNRGVIAGGWSFNYQTAITRGATETPVSIPLGGVASAYPVTFDFSSVPAGVAVRGVELEMLLTHGYPDDLHIVLQSPDGTSVVVMAKAGGGPPGITNGNLFFADFATAFVPDGGPMTAGSYKPGSDYESTQQSLPAPAPPAPYPMQFSAFNERAVRGVWRLWIYDDFPTIGGSLQSASLIINTEATPTVTIDEPTTAATFTASEPFMRLGAVLNTAGPPIDSPHSATWRNVVDGTFYDAGGMTLSGNFAEAPLVPLKKGTNVVTVRALNTLGIAIDTTLTVTVNEFTYYLSEGATGGFFTEEVTLANPSVVSAQVSVDYLPEHSAPINRLATVSPFVPLQLNVNTVVPGDGVSTVVHSTNAVPLAVERTMSWDGNGYGAHGGTAVAPNTRWLFAEGSQGYFDTFLLLASDNAVPVDTDVRFLIEGGGTVTRRITLQPHSRYTLFAGDVPEVVNTSFGMDVQAAAPIIAERSMYFPHNSARIFEGGHESAGVNETSTHWFLAEGATGPFFECFILLSNPSHVDANAHLTYLLPGGETIGRPVVVPANGRVTIDVDGDDPSLANTGVSTIVDSDVGIIVERSMYWPDISIGWYEAHNSFGVTAPALRWAVADGRIGGSRSAQTYVLLANPNHNKAEVSVRYLKDGRTDRVATYELPATSRTNLLLNDVAGTGDGLVSVEVTVLNYQPIVVEKALYWNAGTQIWAAGTGVVGTPLPPP